jgi:Arc/MetJ-type ribon-helix-helix transcriptional regulator
MSYSKSVKLQKLCLSLHPEIVDTIDTELVNNRDFDSRADYIRKVVREDLKARGLI